jgi:TRAP-type C4-dicarboxylate transport system permease small subunit
LKWFAKNIQEFFSGVALTIVIASVCYGVVSRYILHQPATWANELATVMFTWVVFLGASAAFKHKMHIGIDLLVKSVPRKLRIVLVVTANVILLVFLGYVTISGVSFSIVSYKQPTSVLRIPKTFVFLAVPVGFGLMFFHHIMDLIKYRQKWFTGE